MSKEETCFLIHANHKSDMLLKYNTCLSSVSWARVSFMNNNKCHCLENTTFILKIFYLSIVIFCISNNCCFAQNIFIPITILFPQSKSLWLCMGSRKKSDTEARGDEYIFHKVQFLQALLIFSITVNPGFFRWKTFGKTFY